VFRGKFTYKSELEAGFIAVAALTAQNTTRMTMIGGAENAVVEIWK